MIYEIRSRKWKRSSFIQTWDGKIVAANAGFEPMLGQAISVFLDWARTNNYGVEVRQERLAMQVQDGFKLILFSDASNSGFLVRCPTMKDITVKGANSEEAARNGWERIKAELSVINRFNVPKPLPIAEESSNES